MAQTTQKSEPTVETIVDYDVLRALTDGVLALADEAVFEFTPDDVTIRLKDPASVGMIRQIVDADAFAHYDLGGTFNGGLDFRKLDDLLKAADADEVAFGWDWDDYRFYFRADGIDAKIAGVSAEYINGSPCDVMPVKDSLDYTVDATVPVAALKKTTKVVDMAGSTCYFFIGGGDEHFRATGKGDDDDISVDLHDADGFEWRDDPPADEVESRQSNDYLQDFVPLLKGVDTVRFVTGTHLPMHLWATREGCIDTKIMQAPRIPGEN